MQEEHLSSLVECLGTSKALLQIQRFLSQDMFAAFSSSQGPLGSAAPLISLSSPLLFGWCAGTHKIIAGMDW